MTLLGFLCDWVLDSKTGVGFLTRYMSLVLALVGIVVGLGFLCSAVFS